MLADCLDILEFDKSLLILSGNFNKNYRLLFVRLDEKRILENHEESKR